MKIETGLFRADDTEWKLLCEHLLQFCLTVLYAENLLIVGALGLLFSFHSFNDQVIKVSPRIVNIALEQLRTDHTVNHFLYEVSSQTY